MTARETKGGGKGKAERVEEKSDSWKYGNKFTNRLRE